MISLMSLEEWMSPDELEEKEKTIKDDKNSVPEHNCACGRTVCCGKHRKNGQCSCQKVGRQHD